MSFAEDVSLAMMHLGINVNLKNQQREALEAIYEGKDVVCLLPTGYGKSLIYQLAPFLLGQKSGNHNSIGLVISPLNSIMHDQVRTLAARGVAACALDMQCSSGETYKFRCTQGMLSSIILLFCRVILINTVC